jgi:hypothetical protein
MMISEGRRLKAEPPHGGDALKEACEKRDGWRLFEILTVRSLLAIWLVLSLIWGGSVGYNLYHRATIQADTSRDVERDLDQSLIPASCTGPACAGKSQDASDDLSNQTQNWSDIASTYFRFGSMEIGAYALGPPLALLAVVLAAILVFRRRRPG